MSSSSDKKGKRREARERTVQFLFQHEMNPAESLDKAIEEFWITQRANAHAEKQEGATWGEKQEVPPPTADEAAIQLFSEPLIRGVIEHQEKIDAEIQKHAKIGFWDAMVVRAAAESGCDVLWTEDLNDGQLWRGVRVRDPFGAGA